jgi:ribosomal protein L6P/L9E
MNSYIYNIKLHKNIYIKYKNYYNNFYKLEFYSKYGKINYIFSKKIIIKYLKKKKKIYLSIKNKKNKNLIKLYYNLIKNILFSLFGGYFIKFNLKGRGFLLSLIKNNY